MRFGLCGVSNPARTLFPKLAGSHELPDVLVLNILSLGLHPRRKAWESVCSSSTAGTSYDWASFGRTSLGSQIWLLLLITEKAFQNPGS